MYKVIYIRHLIGYIIKRITVIPFFLITGLFCFAQTDSLSHYLHVAAQNNPVVLQNYYEYRASLEKIPQAGSLQDPEVDLGMFLTPMELLGGYQVAELQLMQMFPWFGTLRSARDEMSYMANARYESLRDSKLQVFYDVQITWYELYKIKQEIRISKRNVDILKTIERLAKVKFTNVPTGSVSSFGTQTLSTGRSGNPNNEPGMQGMGNTSQAAQGNQSTSNMPDNSMTSSSAGLGLTDLYIIQIEMGDIQNELALLNNRQKVLQARFNGFLNRPVQTPVFVPDSIIVDTLSFSLHTIEDSMLANNPMLGMLKYEIRSLQSKRKMVTRMGYPMMGIGLNYSVISKNEMTDSEMNGEDMIMPMIRVTLPIYRKKYKALQQETDYSIESVKQQETAASNNLRTEYYEAVQYLEDSKRRIQLYDDQGKLVKSSLNISIQEFTTSSIGLTEILRINQQVLEFDYKLTEAIADYYSAIAWLKRLGAVNYSINMESNSRNGSDKY